MRNLRDRDRARRTAVIVTGALMLAAAGLGAAPAAQASAHPRVVRTAASTTYTGAGQYAYPVPAGTYAVTVTAVGAAGGNGTGNPGQGGQGAEVTATVPLPANTSTLYAEVGGAGQPGNQNMNGGYNGGGSTGTGGTGGGASDVRLDPASTPLSTADTRLVVAGGGGGGGAYCGAPGGTAGDSTVAGAGNGGQGSEAGCGTGAQPGGDGGQDNGTPGTGGFGAGEPCNGGPGSLGQGGNGNTGCDFIFYGGGGGGGYYGGGAGGDGYGSGGGGGAGSSYWAPDATGTSLAENTGGTAAEVIITPVPPSPPAPLSPSTLPDFAAGQANTVTVSSGGLPTPSLTESGPLPDNVTFTDNGDGTGTLAGDPPASDAGNTYDFSITASNGYAPDQTQDYSLFVGQAPAITSAAGATFKVGKAGSFAVTTSGAVPPSTTLTESGPLPGGVTFTGNGNGTGTLAGQPAPGSSLGGDGHGNYAVTFTASNGEGSPTVQDFTLTVQPPAAPRHTGTTTVAGQPVVGQTLTKSGSLSWHSVDPLTISIVWERCTTAATSSCTPLPSTLGQKRHRLTKAAVGDYITFAITATDQDGQSTTYVATPVGPVTG